ncbi:sialic acid-binding Ig-like lectin 8 [Bufo bufo]|uniref:sialic acid-binding Ig-like lectin 8 n=1 Tax=Bufo bufo TaxID=8384 RepID=UPI001ABE4E7B|nr:sialic acid-binding Ig-like lectin 8 [Bufo bufo]
MGLRKGFVFVDYYLALMLIGSQLWSNSVCEELPGYKIDTSPSVTVQRGLCVHVPCSFTVASDKQLSISTTGIWYINNGTQYIAASKNNSVHQTFGRFFITGNVSSGDCSYSIEDPLPADEGRYLFRFEDGPLKFSYQDIHPYVNITDLTDKPNISSTRLVDGKLVTWTCTSPGQCRNIKPRITWEGIIQEMFDITYEDGSRTFHSNITFNPRRSHNNSTLFCRVTFKSGVTTVEKRTLNVEYSPSVIITVEGADTDDITTVKVKDGDSITMKCIVDSNPEASITWYKEEMEVQRTISDRTVTLTLSNITLSDAGRYRCSAENEHGSAHRTVEIIYDNGDSNHITQIILATNGTIYLLLLALLAFACWRKKQKKLTSAEIEATYTNLRRSDITSIYDQLKPEISADTNVIGSEEAAANNYEKFQ